MSEQKQIRITDLESLMQQDDKTLEIHADGTVTVEEVVGPPKPIATYKTDLESTY